MPKVALSLVLLLTVSGCRCGKLATGSCNGTWGGQTLTDATLDPSSRMALLYGATCADATVHLYELSWGKGTVATQFSFTSGGPSILGGKTYPLPPSGFLTFAVQPTPPTPEGTLTLGLRGLAGDRTGELLLKNAQEELRCSFEVSYETEGIRPSCGSSGGGGDGD
jgi:hypothetical protein